MSQVGTTTIVTVTDVRFILGIAVLQSKSIPYRVSTEISILTQQSLVMLSIEDSGVCTVFAFLKTAFRASEATIHIHTFHHGKSGG